MFDHIVIGGGINGLLTAYYLNQAGASVCLLERAIVGKESSWAGGGILSPLYPWRYPEAVTELVQWSQQVYPELVNTLYQSTGLDPELHRSGMLVLSEPQIDQAMNWAQQTHAELSLIDSDQIRHLEPKLGPIPNQALWMPQVGQVRNPRFVAALREHLIRHGVQIQENSEVTDLIVENQAVCGVKTEQADFRAAAVAVTCGAWSSRFWPEQEDHLQITPVKGQMVLLKTEPGLVQRIVLFADKYLIPRLDGRVLIGSTLEHVGFNKSTTDTAQDNLLDFAHHLIPALQDFPVEHHWAGLRPGTPDNIPRICEHPTLKGLFINAGHFRNGVVTAPASAQLLTNLMLKQQTILDPKPYC
ncbi:MAG: glycine oxidase ThiO [Gammaproteobacteria bacterium]|nr:glycine oxidase ThiO [Gammaproteobacteria bacterium]MDH5799415.1 glycine oxidase ThiO [Gammaproteobacteria bacterium]